MIDRLRHIFEAKPELAERMRRRLERNAEVNPDRVSNPVRTLDDLYAWLEHFLCCLPWDGLNLLHRSVFRRIDQSIGYAYYLFGELQYEQPIAEWLIAYNTAWGEWLRSEESWNEHCYQLAKTDARFELTTGKYEEPTSWHCWNDFFCRRLAAGRMFVRQPIAEGIVAPSEGDLYDGPIKTMDDNYPWKDLLGDSPYREQMKNKTAIHLSLDMYHYHRLHAPCDGRIVDLRIIPGMHVDGGEIIWDEAQNRYRYAHQNNNTFQAMETRGVMVIEASGGLIAMVAVGVAQVSSVNWSAGIEIGKEIRQGQEIGWFACGGSDVVVMY